MEIICLRHGESIGNIACHKSYVENDHSYFTSEFKKIPSCDWPLTESGIIHSKKVGQYIKNNFQPIDNYFSSDFPRAKETAILLGLSDHWNYTDLLRERNRGLMDGLSKEQWDKLSKKEGVSFAEDSIDWKPPQGESAREMILRLKKFFDQIKNKNVNRILLVTHGELIQCLRFMIRNLSSDKYSQWIKTRGDVKNCQIYQFKFKQSNSVEEVSYIKVGEVYKKDNDGHIFDAKKLIL